MPLPAHLIRSSFCSLLFLSTLSACGIDSGESEVADCQRSLVVEGQVDSVAAADDKYSKQVVWFNSSAEEYTLNEIDTAAMEEWGLDIDDNADISRYRYFSEAYNLRMILVHELTERHQNTGLPKLGKDLSAYFFDLAKHDVQPGQAVEVFDISEIAQLRSNPNKSLLANKIRELIDEMRSNNQADVLVAFAADRSQESEALNSLINLFSPTAQFAEQGQVVFSDVYDLQGSIRKTMNYPSTDIDAMSIDVDVDFDSQRVTVEAECFGTTVSGD